MCKKQYIYISQLCGRLIEIVFRDLELLENRFPHFRRILMLLLLLLTQRGRLLKKVHLDQLLKLLSSGLHQLLLLNNTKLKIQLQNSQAFSFGK
jgi:hypothetical protein